MFALLVMLPAAHGVVTIPSPWVETWPMGPHLVVSVRGAGMAYGAGSVVGPRNWARYEHNHGMTMALHRRHMTEGLLSFLAMEWHMGVAMTFHIGITMVAHRGRTI
ncbi:hypothetical protein OE88DRAFT_268965 [Heliocybe sulcata]|uniref:Uncharacterized protein n=1 Tax=Heliocybe sulcata TaxID=5364 RepID=A0A5C3N388_9AGAM|nr:hypothetical protein OE88DRAFT_268965 [Heliocybe sulcata]